MVMSHRALGGDEIRHALLPPIMRAALPFGLDAVSFSPSPPAAGEASAPLESSRRLQMNQPIGMQP
jgi:hypothetical protein